MLLSLVRRYDQIPLIHQMRTIIRRWWRVEVIYVDRDGTPVYFAGQPDGLVNRVCAICLGSRGGRVLCHNSMRQASDELQTFGRQGPQISYGCHLGMVRMAAPIMIEERDGGMLYSSGFLDGDAREEARQKIMEASSTIAPALAEPEVFASVPVLSSDDLGRLGDVFDLAVSAIVGMFAELKAKEAEIETLRVRLQERTGVGGLIGSSATMQEVYRLVERVAANDCTVLVRGESGTGKELVANAIHGLSQRAAGPFVVQNCSAFNDNLLESELFGHVRGAFTGAVSDKKGLFEIANNGTLFLDEVAEMSPALQAKLLRVLQDHTFWPVGATTPKHSDVRIVAATHRDLEAMVKAGTFREDLYYRLNVISIVLPPLRERRSDIPELVKHFLRRHGSATLSAEAVRTLCYYDWPGNVRELANELERMVVLGGSSGERPLGRELISARVLQAASGDRAVEPQLRGTLREAVESLEQEMIRAALEQHKGNRSHAAKALGIARSNLLVKMKGYGLG